MIRLKSTEISFDNTHPAVWYAVSVAARVWEELGADLVITAANESGHTTNPDPTKQFHRLPDGSCRAVDLRIWNLSGSSRAEAVETLRTVLGPDYDVIHERPGWAGEHVHVEFDP